MSDPEKKHLVDPRLGKEIKKVEANLVHMLQPEREEPLADEVASENGETTKATLARSKSAFLQLLEPPHDPVLRKKWFRNRFLVLTFAVIVTLVAILIGVDKPVIGAVLVVFGLISQLFSGLVALIGLIPVVGPILVWALSLPFIWLMNALGYVFTIKFTSEGKGKDVLNWRTMTIVFITGIVIGIVIGRLLPAGE